MGEEWAARRAVPRSSAISAASSGPRCARAAGASSRASPHSPRPRAGSASRTRSHRKRRGAECSTPDCLGRPLHHEWLAFHRTLLSLREKEIVRSSRRCRRSPIPPSSAVWAFPAARHSGSSPNLGPVPAPHGGPAPGAADLRARPHEHDLGLAARLERRLVQKRAGPMNRRSPAAGLVIRDGALNRRRACARRCAPSSKEAPFWTRGRFAAPKRAARSGSPQRARPPRRRAPGLAPAGTRTPGLAVHDHLGDAADPARHDGRAAGHRLEVDEPEGLVHRGRRTPSCVAVEAAPRRRGAAWGWIHPGCTAGPPPPPRVGPRSRPCRGSPRRAPGRSLGEVRGRLGHGKIPFCSLMQPNGSRSGARSPWRSRASRRSGVAEGGGVDAVVQHDHARGMDTGSARGCG